MTALKTRKPTARAPWPFVLIEGPEKTGKSYAMAEFTAQEWIGAAYWLDLGEGSADEYAEIPDTKYEVIEHDGTWPSIIAQAQAVYDEALRAQAAGEPPVVFLVDSMTIEWELLKDEVGKRARTTKTNREKLQRDPNAEIKPAMNLWNDANDRHSQLMRILMRFPGIAVATARGKMVAELDANGRPIPNSKVYKVEGHKNLAFDASAWVRLSREDAPLVIGVRSALYGVKPGVDKPVHSPEFTIDWLIRDVLKCKPGVTGVRNLTELRPEVPESREPAEPAGQGRPAERNAAASFADKLDTKAKAADDGEVQRRAADIGARIRDATDISVLGDLWKEAGQLTPDWTAVLRTDAETKVAKLKAEAEKAAVDTVADQLGGEPVAA